VCLRPLRYDSGMRDIILIVHNVRSTHNVGSLLRTAEGLGVSKVYLTGYTPYPQHEGDVRLPHIAVKLTAQIHKTALDAEGLIAWEYRHDVLALIDTLAADGYEVTAIEQAKTAIALPDFRPSDKIALLVGREVEGVEPEVLAACSGAVEIPMYGHKESFNVVQATAMVLYHCRFAPE
jgi:23S rRNA (guanosine2251-2'-O)-methyltransferase